MAARTPPSASVPQSRLSDTEKMDGTGSWEAIEWTKNEVNLDLSLPTRTLKLFS